MMQFMLYTGMPVTRLYEDHKARGLLKEDLPYEEWHGQNELNWNHPAFPGGEAKRWLDLAFQRDFEVNSSSIYRMAETALRGYRTLAAMPSRDACLETRRRQLGRRARLYSHLLPLIADRAVNEEERRRAVALDAEQRELLGPLGARERILRFGAGLLAARWDVRLRLLGDRIQPATIVTHFHAGPRR